MIINSILKKFIFKIHQGKSPSKLSFFLPFPFIFFVLSFFNRKRRRYANDSLIVKYMDDESFLKFDVIFQEEDFFFLKHDFKEDPFALYEISKDWQYHQKPDSRCHKRKINLLFKMHYSEYLNVYINTENPLFAEKIIGIIRVFFDTKKNIHFLLEKKIISNQFTTLLDTISTSLAERAAIAARCDFYCGDFDLVGKALLCNEIPALYNTRASEHTNNQQFFGKVFEKNLENLNDEELKSTLYPLLRGIDILK